MIGASTTPTTHSTLLTQAQMHALQVLNDRANLWTALLVFITVSVTVLVVVAIDIQERRGGKR